jgi:hypothetical protein
VICRALAGSERSTYHKRYREFKRKSRARLAVGAIGVGAFITEEKGGLLTRRTAGPHGVRLRLGGPVLCIGVGSAPNIGGPDG